MDEIETKAYGMGWRPKEEFRGAPENWVSAQEFVERGEKVLPIMKSHTRKLEADLARLTAENQRLASLFQASQESIAELHTFHEENLKEQLKRQKRELAERLAVAREEGDTVAEVDIQAEIAAIGQKKPEPKPAPAAPAAPPQPQVDPDLAAWQHENPWFGTDARKTQRAIGIAQILSADEPDLKGAAFYAEVSRRMSGEHSPGVSKVGGGRPSGDGGHGGGSGTGYDSLPPEARRACDLQAKKLVGEGRAFKDTAAWRAYYAKVYFDSEAKRGA